jgi:hypothetical protein
MSTRQFLAAKELKGHKEFFAFAFFALSRG